MRLSLSLSVGALLLVVLVVALLPFLVPSRIEVDVRPTDRGPLQVTVSEVERHGSSICT